jgi:hypothetical protein
MLFLRRSKRSRLLLSSAFLFALLGLLTLTTSASAATVTAPATSTYGHPLEGSITIDDAIDPGNLVITLSIDAARGDVRGFLAHVADESLLAGLSVVGEDERSFRFDADSVGKSKKSRGLGRTGTACPCDLGVGFSAKSGTTVTFTLTHETQELTLGLFYGQDFAIQASGIRVAYEQAGRRGRSIRHHGIRHSLLEGRIPSPIPEPGTAMLMALGLAGLSLVGPSAGRPQ